MRFLTRDLEIRILGLFVGVQKTTKLVGERTINLENVQNILGNSKLSPSAEKCKDFLQMFMKGDTSTSMELMNRMQGLNLNGNLQASNQSYTSNATSNELKLYMDLKFKELEERISTRLDEMERSQNDKLSRILELLVKSEIKDDSSQV